MKRRSFLFLFGLLLAGTLGATSTAPVVSASEAWIRLLPAGLPAAGYVTLHNDSDRSRRLLGADSDDFGGVMLHESLQEGSARMRMVEGMDIPAHDSAALAPGGFHFMLTAPTRTLAVGERVILTLRFDDGSELPVAFEVRPANADGAPAHMHAH